MCVLSIISISFHTMTTTSVTYSSTRGGQKKLDFRSVVMTGLAHDRGLFVPDTIPSVSNQELQEWAKLPFDDLAIKVISKFVKEDQVPSRKLEDIVKRSCEAFRHQDVTPVVSIGGHYIMVCCCCYCIQLYLCARQGMPALRETHIHTYSHSYISCCVCFSLSL